MEGLLGGASFHSLDSGRVEGDGAANLGFSDFAVLYRTDRQSRALVGALTTAGLPFQKRSRDRLADRPGVARILGELAYAAKGLEFPVVFVVGCEDGLLPLRPPGAAPGETDEEQVAEERRLLFVGMTRAQRRLYLTHAAERLRHGSVRGAAPSPFLAELEGLRGDGVCERIGGVPRPRQRRDTQLRLM